MESKIHGYNKRRFSFKLHLGIDSTNQEIVCEAISTNDYKDNELLEDCLE